MQLPLKSLWVFEAVTRCGSFREPLDGGNTVTMRVDQNCNGDECSTHELIDRERIGDMHYHLHPSGSDTGL